MKIQIIFEIIQWPLGNNCCSLLWIRTRRSSRCRHTIRSSFNVVRGTYSFPGIKCSRVIETRQIFSESTEFRSIVYNQNFFGYLTSVNKIDEKLQTRQSRIICYSWKLSTMERSKFWCMLDQNFGINLSRVIFQSLSRNIKFFLLNIRHLYWCTHH